MGGPRDRRGAEFRWLWPSLAASRHVFVLVLIGYQCAAMDSARVARHGAHVRGNQRRDLLQHRVSRDLREELPHQARAGRGAAQGNASRTLAHGTGEVVQ